MQPTGAKTHADVLILGAGALGSAFGSLLAEGGLDVRLFTTNAQHSDAIRQAGGVELRTAGGNRFIRVGVISDPADLSSAGIVVFLCKGVSTLAAAQSARHLFGSQGAVAVTFQNGLGNEEVIASVVGADRVLAGLSAQGARVLAPGVVEHLGHLPTYVGELSGGLSERALELAERFTSSGLPVVASPDIMREKWKKLFANIAFSALSACSGLRIGEIGSDLTLRKVATAAVDEAATVAHGRGMRFTAREKFEVFNQLLDNPGPASNVSAMRNDVVHGKKLELQQIYGEVICRAAELNINVPTLRALAAIVHAVEIGGKRERSAQLDFAQN